MNKGLLTRLMAFFAALLLLPAMGIAQESLDAGPDLDEGKDYYALIITNKGNIALDLFESKTPVTVKNFVNLAEGTREWKDPVSRKVVKKPLYNGVVFHRVIPEFMIQAGDPTGSGAGSIGYQFKDEFVSSLNFTKPGLLAMANRGPATNTSQFFITEVPTPHLNQKHTIFGEVLEGTDSLAKVKEIARVPHNRTRPIDPVVMERIQIFRVDPGTPAEKIREMMENPNAAMEKEKASEEAAKEEEKAEEKKEEGDRIAPRPPADRYKMPEENK